MESCRERVGVVVRGIVAVGMGRGVGLMGVAEMGVVVLCQEAGEWVVWKWVKGW